MLYPSPKCILSWAATLLFTQSAYARVHPYETTRLKSTAGTGVASILLDEGAILNPAPLAFFKSGAIYLQMINSEYTLEESSSSDDYSETDDTKGVIISDAKGQFKGSVSYTTQKEAADERKRLSIGLGHVFKGKSAFGLLYKYSKDENYSVLDDALIEDNYGQVSFGAIHAISENISFGAVINDPLKEKSEDNNFTIGAQYIYKRFIALMADLGSDYNRDLSERFMYRLAVQLNLYDNFYIRTGMFKDSYLKEKGNGVGLSWVGPRFSIEAAFKYTKPFGPSESSIAYGAKIKETSFSLSYIL